MIDTLAVIALLAVLAVIERTRRALKRSESKMRAVMRALPDLVFEQSAEGVFVDYYAGMNALYVPAEQFLGRRHVDVLPPDVARVIVPAFDRVVKTSEPATVEYQLPMPGGIQYYEARLVPLAPASVLSIVRDVSARRRAELELERTRYFTQRLGEAVPNVVFLYDLEERRNIYVNDRCEAVLGYTADEIIRLGDQFLAWTMHPDDLKRLPVMIREYQTLKDGELVHHVFRFKHKSGEWRWIQRTAMMFARTPDGKPRQLIGSATDITALKHAERDLRQLSARLLTTQDEERRRIARDLHDGVAQVLAGIGARLSTLRTRPDLPKAVVDELDESARVCAEGLSEARLMSSLLHPPLLDDVGLVPALKWFADGFGRRSRVAIDVVAEESAERLPTSVERDLFRIVQEGLANVARHSGSDKAVVRLSRNGGEAVLEVQDFGRGMPPNTEHSSGTATGVGILGMRERLHHVGGRLEIESGAGGTRLTAVVPIVAGSRPEP